MTLQLCIAFYVYILLSEINSIIIIDDSLSLRYMFSLGALQS